MMGTSWNCAKRPLQERKLNFQRMFVLFSGTVVAAARQPDRSALFGQRRRKGLVHRDSAQGRNVGVAVVNRGEGERLVVRGGDNHHAVKLAVLEQCVAVACDGSREGISGMGSNQRNQRFIDGRDLRRSQKSIHHLAQFVGTGRVERSRDAGWPHFSLPAGLRAGRQQEQERQRNEYRYLCHDGVISSR